MGLTLEERLAELRVAGWSVAAHYDFRTTDSEVRTYWLFARSGVCVEGSGTHDHDALDEVFAEIGKRKAASARMPDRNSK